MTSSYDSNGTKRWALWLAPAVLMGLCSLAFAVGVYVGEGRVQVQLAELEGKVESHNAQPRHERAVGVMELNVEFREIHRRLGNIEQELSTLIREPRP